MKFYNGQGITHEFSSARTPQYNNVIQKKNRTLMGIIQNYGG